MARIKQIQTRVNPETYDHIVSQAEQAGISIAAVAAIMLDQAAALGWEVASHRVLVQPAKFRCQAGRTLPQ
jgi:hypothetical protein